MNYPEIPLTISVINDFILQSLFLTNEDMLVKSLDCIEKIKAEPYDIKLFETIRFDVISIQRTLQKCFEVFTDSYNNLVKTYSEEVATKTTNAEIKPFIIKMIKKHPEMCTEELVCSIDSYVSINKLYPYIKEMIVEKLLIQPSNKIGIKINHEELN